MFKRLAHMTGAVVVSVSSPTSSAGAPRDTSHHASSGGFVNPWPSFGGSQSFSPMTMWELWREMRTVKVPPKEQLPKIVTPDWGAAKEGASAEEVDKARAAIKATWLGHACFLVEFPAAVRGERGLRVLFDPVFSHRCSPSQYVGPARVTPPPIPLEQLPHVDAVVLSHNHYDHTDVTTLKHIYAAQSKGSVHFFAPLGNAKWFHSIGVKPEHVTELDWWQDRDLTLSAAAASPDSSSQHPTLRITCTPCQHFTGRGLHDRYKTLWASWNVRQLASSATDEASVAFMGDTGYRYVPKGTTDLSGLPTCPAFKEIGERMGLVDLAMIPIGAYDPRWFMSRVHCAPEDSVEVHRDIKSKRSIGMHWATWVLTSEEMTEPPKRLRESCRAIGIPDGEFDVCDIGETVVVATSGNAAAEAKANL